MQDTSSVIGPAPHIAAKKSLGQHFLRDRNIARNIVGALAPSPGDVVVEVGAGTGALTGLLAATGCRVIAVDVDERALRMLDEQRVAQGWTSVEVVHADFCTLDLAALYQREQAPLRILGNLPYNITSQVLFHVFDFSDMLLDAVFMMQKEVAERLTARPATKEYGILSVMTQLHADVRPLFKVSPEVFVPKPKVWSRVVALRFLRGARSRMRDFERFRAIVRGSFGKRRKTMLNCLRFLSVDPASLPGDLGFLLPLRPENLTIDHFIALADALS
jgi:16S rRNA (adenine1518-N6/adenine1519-N6)-dimethyltransferase